VTSESSPHRKIDLSNVGLKLSRALYNYSELEAITRIAGMALVSMDNKWNPIVGGHNVTYDGPQLPDGLGVIVGDMIHNVRSAADLTISALVKSNGKEQTTDNCFPIYSEERKYRAKIASSRNPLIGLADSDAEIVESYQPFRLLTSTQPRLGTGLLTMQSVSNADKHRAIQAAGLKFVGPDIAVQVRAGVPAKVTSVIQRIRPGDSIEPGTIIATIRMIAIPGIALQLDVRFDSVMAFFDDNGSSIVLDDIVNCIEAVRRFVQEFDNTFKIPLWDSSYRSIHDVVIAETKATLDAANANSE
jgi:hypothetical protein